MYNLYSFIPLPWPLHAEQYFEQSYPWPGSQEADIAQHLVESYIPSPSVLINCLKTSPRRSIAYVNHSSYVAWKFSLKCYELIHWVLDYRRKLIVVVTAVLNRHFVKRTLELKGLWHRTQIYGPLLQYTADCLCLNRGQTTPRPARLPWWSLACLHFRVWNNEIQLLSSS